MSDKISIHLTVLTLAMARGRGLKETPVGDIVLKGTVWCIGEKVKHYSRLLTIKDS